LMPKRFRDTEQWHGTVSPIDEDLNRAKRSG
jgi:hypothetical protein